MTHYTTEQRKPWNKKYLSKPEVKAARAKLNREWIANNRERYNKAKSIYRFKTKVEVLSLYSETKLCCAICGYDKNVDALCLDHINDNGAEHRKELGVSSRGNSSGTTIYERIKALGQLPGLQVLCANCNTIKEIQRKRGGETSDVFMKAVKEGFSWK